MNTGVSGWQCTICGQWVNYNQPHMCGGSPSFNQPGSLMIPPCRAPWNPLSAEAVRLIIREELERYFKANPQGESK